MRFPILRRPRRAFRRSLNVLLAAAVLTIGPGASHPALATHGDPVEFCVDGLFSLFLVGFGPPGQSDTFTVTSNPGGHIAFSASTSGPFSDPFTISMTFGADGFGRTADFFMKGLATGATQVEASSPLQGNIDPLEVVVDRITGIELTDSEDVPLESDPKDPTAGDDFRIFPDVDAPGQDVTPFRQVKAIATTELQTEGLRVEFRGFDMDDPSSDPVVDPNGEFGGDNFGSGATIGFNAFTNADGEATTTLTVSRQPGDNFRVTASCALGLQNGLSAIGLEVVKANGDPRPAEVKQSGLITVWRHLHIEADSMGAVAGNELRGIVSRAQNATLRRRSQPPFQGIKVVLPREVVDSAGDQVDFRIFNTDEFQDGEIVIGGTPFPVRFSEGSTVWIDAGPDPRSLRGAPFELVDDDKLGGGLHDDGTEVPQPDLSFLSESDSQATNWFADVYIRPVHLPGSEENLPFRINLDEPDEGYCRVLEIPCPAGQSSFDHAANASDPNFWVVYLLGAYQGPLGTDGDPDIDPFAATDQNRVTLERADVLGHGAAVFLESIRDEGGAAIGICSAAGVAVHGLAHQFTGPGHVAGDTGIMAAGCVDGSGTWSPQSEFLIRSAVAP